MARKSVQCAPRAVNGSYSAKPTRVAPPQTESEAKEQARAFMQKHANLMRALAES